MSQAGLCPLPFEIMFRQFHTFNPFPNSNILDWSKVSILKEFADDKIKFDENGRKFSKQIENTVGKGKIACYKQFIHTFFQKIRMP